MFDVDLLVENQRKQIKTCLESSGSSDSREGINRGNYKLPFVGVITPNTLDDFVREVFSNFPLRDSDRLKLYAAGGPMPELEGIVIMSRPKKIRERFGGEDFSKRYTKCLVREIEKDLALVAPSCYLFAMWIPIYSVDQCGRIMTHFAKKVLPVESA